MKKSKIVLYPIIVFGLALALTNGCTKEEEKIEVITNEASSITSTTAICGGNVINDGGSQITEKGICYNTSPHPTLENSIIKDTGTSDSFTCLLNGLSSNTSYYVRAYAMSNDGVTYGNEVKFITNILIFNPNLTYGSVSDIDGNTYKTIVIGTQEWMAENLKTTKYSNGSVIPNVTDNSSWVALTTGAYCWYDNNLDNKNYYGALYNGYCVLDSRNLCPLGWHVSTDNDWTILETYLGGSNIAATKLKSTALWASSRTSGDNTSGFSALPGGSRLEDDGNMGNLSYVGNWWTSTLFESSVLLYREMTLDRIYVSRVTDRKGHGNSVRCVKDN